MVRIVYIEHDGVETELDVQEGWTLMQAAVSNGINGIEAECGGACCCATCHVYVSDHFLEKIPPASEQEADMLGEVIAERTPNSRLACQIKVTSALQGISIRVAEVQS
jgi:ferredoxin, 2Fe-2S